MCHAYELFSDVKKKTVAVEQDEQKKRGFSRENIFSKHTVLKILVAKYTFEMSKLKPSSK